MAQVGSAEKEASEVLHSLLSVERVEKIETKSPSSSPVASFTTDDNTSEVQWTSSVSIGPTIITTTEANGQFFQTMDEDEVIWEGDSIQVEQDTTSGQLSSIYETDPLGEDEQVEEEEVEITEVRVTTPKLPTKRLKVKSVLKKKKKLPTDEPPDPFFDNSEPTKLETSAAQVKERFKRGCECQDESCFRGLNAETVYKHRLNIAELTKGEHDMYLMGVTMACLANPDTTVRQKERRRLRAQYVYQGRRVCLDAFLYLENCTHYQLKRIRKHVMTHGVAPRVHGNHGKKPHNTFSLDIYRHATEFLKQYMVQNTGTTISNSKQPIQLPWDITRKNLHDAYKEYGQILGPGIKLMGYSTFRHFMKEQFPHVKFSKIEPKCAQQPSQSQPQTQQTLVQQPQPQPQPQTVQQTTVTTVPVQQQIQAMPVAAETHNIQIQKCVISNEVQQVIPLVMTPNDNGTHHPQTFIVTPVPHIFSNGSLTQANATANSFSYQLTNGYVINEQGNIVTTMANTQHSPFSLNRI